MTWFILGGLMILSYGFCNVPLPLPGLRIPLVDALLAYALVASFPAWRDITRTALGRWIRWALLALTVVAGLRFYVFRGSDALIRDIYVRMAGTQSGGFQWLQLGTNDGHEPVAGRYTPRWRNWTRTDRLASPLSIYIPHHGRPVMREI